MDRTATVRVAGPLGPHSEGFRGELRRLGYTPLSAMVHIRLMARLSGWMDERGLAVSGLTTEMVGAFFAERRALAMSTHAPLGLCNPWPVTCAAWVSCLRRFRRFRSVTAAELLLADYGEYLERERGLPATTVALNLRLVRPFLAGRASARDGRLDLDQLTLAR